MERKAAMENPTGQGDVRALVGDLRERVEGAIEGQFEELERQLTKRVAERLANADALIARLTAENARLLKENEKQGKTLEKLRELATDA